MPLLIIYVHDEPCSRKGQTVEVRPYSNDGVSMLDTPTCDETLTELRRVSVERY